MHDQMMLSLLGGPVRHDLLRYLCEHPEDHFSITELAAALGQPSGKLHKLLQDWSEQQLIVRTGAPRHWRYRLNPSPDLWPLRQLLDPIRHLAKRVTARLDEMEGIDIALIFGSIARGDYTAESDVDLLVVGNAEGFAVNLALKPLGRELGRPIHAGVYTRDELLTRYARGDSILLGILSGKTIALIGNIYELTQHPNPGEGH